MSKRCPECRNMNEDSRIFCAFCGATLDANLRLIQEMEKQTERPEQPREERRSEVKLYSTYSTPKKAEKKKSAAPWIILGLIAAAAIVWFLVK